MSRLGVSLTTAGIRQDEPFESFVERNQQVRSATPGFGDTVSAALRSEQLLASGFRLIQRSGFRRDPSFPGLFALPEDEFKAATDGIGPEFYGLLGEAVSREHLGVLRGQALDIADANRTLEDAGFGGLVARIGSAILDPVAIGLTIGTGGLAGGARAGKLTTQLGRGVRGVDRAERLRRLSRAGMVTGAVLGGTTEGLIEAGLSASDPTRGDLDILFAAIGGTVLGGIGGNIAGRFQARELERVIKTRRDLEFAEWRQVQSLAGQDRVRLNDRGRAYFRDQINPDTGRVFYRDVIDSMGFEGDELADLNRLIDEGDFDEAARRLGEIPDNILDAPRQPAGQGRPIAAMGAASSGEFDALQRGLPAWLTGIPDLFRRFARGDIEANEAARLAGQGDEAAEELASLRESILAEQRAGSEGFEPQAGDYFASFTDRKATTAFEKGIDAVRFSIAGRAVRSKSEPYRLAMGGLVQDIVPKAGRVQGEAASEAQNRWYRVFAGQTVRHYGDSYRAYKKAGGKLNQTDFRREVGAAIRSGDLSRYSPEVADAARGHIELNKQMLAFAQRHGILRDVPENEQYLARLYSDAKIDAAIEQYGSEAVESLFATAFRSARPDVDEADATRIGRAMLAVLRNRRLDAAERRMVINGADPDIIRAQLRGARGDGIKGATDLTDGDIERITEALAGQLRAGPKGAGQDGPTLTSREKRRVTLDETASIPVTARTGESRQLFFTDLIEDDPLAVGVLYSRQIAGASVMRKYLDAASVEFGRPFQTITDLRDFLERDLADTVSESARKASLRAFDTAIDAIMGRRMGSDSMSSAWLRNIMLYNQVTLGGALGVASLPELGVVAFSGTLRSMRRGMPGLRNFFRAANRGGLSDRSLAYVDRMVGILNEGRTHIVLPRSNIGDAFNTHVGGGAEHGLRRLSRFQDFASGIAQITQYQKMWAAEMAADDLANLARTRGRLGRKRIEALGLDDDMADRIVAQTKKYGVSQEGVTGARVENPNLDKWDDIEAASAFVAGVRRWADTAVQTPDIGQLFPFATTDIGRMIFQYRNFVIVAWEKQFLRRVALHDINSFAEVSAAALIAAMAYTAQTYRRSLGREDAEEYREERLSIENIAKAGFMRSGFSSFLPQIWDTAMVASGGSPDFAYGRNTQQPTDFFSNPTTDLINAAAGPGGVLGTLGEFVRGGDKAAITPDEIERSKRLIPLGRFIAVENAINALGTLGDEEE